MLNCDGSSFHGDEPSMVCSVLKPLGAAGLWTGHRPWTRHLGLTVAAFSSLFPRVCSLFRTGSCLPSPWLVGVAHSWSNQPATHFVRCSPWEYWGLDDITPWTTKSSPTSSHTSVCTVLAFTGELFSPLSLSGSPIPSQLLMQRCGKWGIR